MSSSSTILPALLMAKPSYIVYSTVDVVMMETQLDDYDQEEPTHLPGGMSA